MDKPITFKKVTSSKINIKSVGNMLVSDYCRILQSLLCHCEVTKHYQIPFSLPADPF